jgi:hypothetical protein
MQCGGGDADQLLLGGEVAERPARRVRGATELRCGFLQRVLCWLGVV